MKKVLFLLTIFFISFSPISSASTNANLENGCNFIDIDESQKVTLLKKQHSSPEELYKNAQNNISYLTNEELNIHNSAVTLQNANQKTTKKLNAISTSELIERYSVNGVIYEEFSVTQFIDITENDLTDTIDKKLASLKPDEITPLAIDFDEDMDGSMSVRIESTNKYTKSGNCLDLESVYGTWTILDRQVSVGTKRVNYGQLGRSCKDGGSYIHNQRSSDLYPSSMSYNYTVPSSWIPVNQNADATEIGHTSTIDLTRGNSKWVFQLQNKIVLY